MIRYRFGPRRPTSFHGSARVLHVPVSVALLHCIVWFSMSVTDGFAQPARAPSSAYRYDIVALGGVSLPPGSSTSRSSLKATQLLIGEAYVDPTSGCCVYRLWYDALDDWALWARLRAPAYRTGNDSGFGIVRSRLPKDEQDRLERLCWRGLPDHEDRLYPVVQAAGFDGERYWLADFGYSFALHAGSGTPVEPGVIRLDDRTVFKGHFDRGSTVAALVWVGSSPKELRSLPVPDNIEMRGIQVPTDMSDQATKSTERVGYGVSPEQLEWFECAPLHRLAALLGSQDLRGEQLVSAMNGIGWASEIQVQDIPWRGFGQEWPRTEDSRIFDLRPGELSGRSNAREDRPLLRTHDRYTDPRFHFWDYVVEIDDRKSGIAQCRIDVDSYFGLWTCPLPSFHIVVRREPAIEVARSMYDYRSYLGAHSRVITASDGKQPGGP